MSAGHVHDAPFPRAMLVGAGVIVGGALLMATSVRLGILPISASPVAIRAEAKLQPTMTRDLAFADRADGAVVITDTRTGELAKLIARDSQSGFIRGTMRGMMRERRMHKFAENVAFRLAAWPDGSLSLTDTGTGRTIELGAFGATNRAAFAELLP